MGPWLERAAGGSGGNRSTPNRALEGTLDASPSPAGIWRESPLRDTVAHAWRDCAIRIARGGRGGAGSSGSSWGCSWSPRPSRAGAIGRSPTSRARKCAACADSTGTSTGAVRSGSDPLRTLRARQRRSLPARTTSGPGVGAGGKDTPGRTTLLSSRDASPASRGSSAGGPQILRMQ